MSTTQGPSSARKSIGGIGTPLADAGLKRTLDRRVSLGVAHEQRSPLAEIVNGTESRHTYTENGTTFPDSITAAKNAIELASLTKAIGGQMRKSIGSSHKFSIGGSYTSTSARNSFEQQGQEKDVSLMSLVDNDAGENSNSNSNQIGGRASSRFSLMMQQQLDTYPEESSSRETSVSASHLSAQPEKGEEDLAYLRSHLASAHNLALYDSSTLSLNDTDGINSNANKSQRMSFNRDRRRSSMLSQLSDEFGLHVDEAENDPQNRLSIQEVLRSFREDPGATENAIALVSATGKLLPSDFRKFVRAFKSPKGKKSKAAVVQATVEPVGAGIALRSWQDGTGTIDDNVDTESHQEADQSLLMDITSSPITADRSEKPWTENELCRASDALRRASISFSMDTSFPLADSLDDSTGAGDDVENMEPEYNSPLEQLQAELENLRSDMATQKEEFHSAMKAKDKHITEVLNNKLEGLRYNPGTANNSKIEATGLDAVVNMHTRSFSEAVQEMKSVEDARMLHEMNTIKRNINRLNAFKMNLLERRENRRRRLEEIDDMEDEGCLHMDRRRSGAYVQFAGGYLPSPGEKQFNGLPPPRMASGSAFARPAPRWTGPVGPVGGGSSSSSSHHSAQNDYDDADYGGGDDMDYRYDQQQELQQKKPAKKREYKAKPIFKASPSTRYGRQSGLNFVAMDKDDDLLEGEMASEDRIQHDVENSMADYGDLNALDEEYRREKRMANALKREEARRFREQEGSDESNSDNDGNDDYKKKRLHTFQSHEAKRGVGRPKGTTKAAMANKVGMKVSAKRGRGPGRPIGSLGKKKKMTLSNAVDAVVPRRPVGRPPKVVTEAKKAEEKATKAANRKVAKTVAQLDAMRQGEVILSAKQVKALETRLEKEKAAATSAAAGIIKPKRAMTSYIAFCNANRAEVTEANPEQNGIQKEIMRLLAMKWKECTEEDKVIWQGKADEENAAYAAANPTLATAVTGADADADADAPRKRDRSSEEAVAEYDAAPKRTRGRPKKVRTPEELEAAANKKPRGRPKKNQPPASIANPILGAAESDDDDGNLDEAQAPHVLLAVAPAIAAPVEDGTVVLMKDVEIEVEAEAEVEMEMEMEQATSAEPVAVSIDIESNADEENKENIEKSTANAGIGHEKEVAIVSTPNKMNKKAKKAKKDKKDKKKGTKRMSIAPAASAPAQVQVQAPTPVIVSKPTAHASVGRKSGVGVIAPLNVLTDANTHIHFDSADNSLTSIDTARL